MFKINLLNFNATASKERTLRFTKYLWTPLCIAGLLIWNLNLISIGVLSAQEINSRATLTELLFKAVRTNNINAARTAIEAGAELSRINLNGQTAIDIAISNNHFKMANYLVFARRIEQQSELKIPAAIYSVQHGSPEAAPIVNISRDNLPAAVPATKKNISLNKNEQKAKKDPMQTTIKQGGILAKELVNQNQAATNISKTKIQTPQQELTRMNFSEQRKKIDKTVSKITKQELKSSTPIFLMDVDGYLIKSTAAEIRRIQKTIKQKPARLLPDIETRKSLFIPKPRTKPNFIPPVVERPPHTRKNKISKLAGKLNITASKNPEPTAPKSQLPNVHKSSNLQTLQNKFTKIDRIRPTRRISPELLKKLRNGLEKTKLQRNLDTEKTKNAAVRQLNLPITPPKLRKKINTVPLPAVKIYPKEISKVAPQASIETIKETSKAEEKNIFGKILSDVTNFFSIASDTKDNRKDIELSVDKSKTKTRQSHNPVKKSKKLQPIEPPIKNRPTAQLSLVLTPSNYKKTNPKFKWVGTTEALNSYPLKKHMAKTRETNDKQPSIKEITPHRLNAIDELFQSDPNFYVEAKQKKAYSTGGETNHSPLRQHSVSMPLTRLRKPLTNVSLTLGNSVATGQTKLPRGIAEPNPCIQKRRGKISFCIIPIDWPQKIENTFSINTSLYQGTRAIARYDNGKATHFHVLYKTANHDRIINFMKERYGPHTDIWKRVIAPFGKPRQSNPTFIWRSHNTDINEVTILEVRKFDDSRTVFPDTEHGAIRLYTAGGPPVFPIITAHDIMSIDWAARSDHLDDGSPALARTIRVQP